MNKPSIISGFLGAAKNRYMTYHACDVASTTLGIIIGALPGLSATMGIALLTGLTFTQPKMDAITVLMGIYLGAIYGGSITAVLINIPGTGSAAATALDGFPLAVKGEAKLP